MNDIILIKGKVKYTITLDPGVWIFDDRKQDLHSYFHDQKEEEKDSLEAYTKAVSKHWDREIVEGAIYPPTLKTEKKFLKEKLITGSFCIPLKPFFQNAEIDEDATKLVIVTKDGDIELSVQSAYDLIAGFSKDGKPLTEDGPIHIYFKDGSNYNDPIKYVKEFSFQ